MDSYLVPSAYGEAELVEKRSRFIGQVWRVEREEEARARLEEVRRRFHDARHHCWCYVLREGNILRYGDDGEPQGTAGQPMLNVFLKEEVVNAVCVVTRYFGGILLGAGGLTRAYGGTAKLALDAAGISRMRLWSVLMVPCPYPLYERMRLLVEKCGGAVESADFGADVVLTVLLPAEDAAGFQAQAALQSLTQAAHTQKVYITEAQARYEQTKSFRHDIRNHLSVLDGLLKNGKLAESREFLKKLDTVSEALSFPYQTGNPVVDILLGEKLGLAKEITAEVSLVLPKPCGIDDFDLCVLFANALDNAIAACRAIDGTKAIRISGKQQGDFYMLTFENTCPDGPLPPAGTGVSNIQAVAEKYHGAVLTEKSGGRFCLSVLLNASSSVS